MCGGVGGVEMVVGGVRHSTEVLNFVTGFRPRLRGGKWREPEGWNCRLYVVVRWQSSSASSSSSPSFMLVSNYSRR